MKKPITILLIVIAVLAIAAGAYWFGSRSAENKQSVSQTNANLNSNANTNINLAKPNVAYEPFSGDLSNYSFDIVKEWIKVAPEEIQKSITEEQRHGYDIIYYSTNPDGVVYSISEKRIAENWTMSQVVTDDSAASQKSTPGIVVTGQKINEADAFVELSIKNETSDYVLYYHYLMLPVINGQYRWAMMEIFLSKEKVAPYQEVITHLQDSLKIGTGTSVNGKLDLSMFQWSQMNEGPYRDRVTYATSPNLTTWTPSRKILAEHASVPGAVIKNDVIYVYFVDVSIDGKVEQLGMVSSSDNGQTWTDRKILTISGLGNRATADPDPVLLEDGRIRLYYFDINEARISKPESGIESTNKIYSAISSDGINFTQEEEVRFERQGIFDPDVNLFGDTWYLYGGDIESNKVVVATSTDGLTFEEKGIAYANGAVPDVFQANDLFYLFTAGIDIATSLDPMSFVSSGQSFHDSNYQITADPSVVQLNDGTYLMLYKIKN